MSKASNPQDGRTPPPEHRFLKGSTGNKAGRPKGAISLKRITRKVALKKHTVVIDGVSKKMTLLELVIFRLVALSSSGISSAVTLEDDLRKKLMPDEAKSDEYGLMPESFKSDAEWIAAMEADNLSKKDPRTHVNLRSEEFRKAAKGEPTKLGEALLASHHKWGNYRKSPFD
ncbi:MAG: DUF5681 domain-containing protein [Afipia sp.]